MSRKRCPVDHSRLSWMPQDNRVLMMVKISDLRATIIGEAGVRELRPIRETPHWRLANNNDIMPYALYAEHAGKDAGFGIEHSVDIFDELIKHWDQSYYGTEGPNSFVQVRWCHEEAGERDTYVITDGVHRATILASKGYTEIPVMYEAVRESDPTQFDQYLADFENDFKEWYTPLEFKDDKGGHHIIHERTYPQWQKRPDFLTNKERGRSKWDYIIRPNIPRDLSNWRVLDLGCNVGLFSILMSDMGASVVGIDRGAGVVQPTNTGLGSESVVQQAYFVKNLTQLWDGRHRYIDYIEKDIANERICDVLDAYDINVLFSCCVIYHFGRERMIEILESCRKCHTIVLQANHGHGGALGLLASADTHVGILRHLGYKAEIKWGRDGDTTYKYPLIIGTK